MTHLMQNKNKNPPSAPYKWSFYVEKELGRWEFMREYELQMYTPIVQNNIFTNCCGQIIFARTHKVLIMLNAVVVYVIFPKGGINITTIIATTTAITKDGYLNVAATHPLIHTHTICKIPINILNISCG